MQPSAGAGSNVTRSGDGSTVRHRGRLASNARTASFRARKGTEDASASEQRTVISDLRAAKMVMEQIREEKIKFKDLFPYALAMGKVALEGLRLKVDDALLYGSVCDVLPNAGARMRLRNSLASYGSLLRSSQVVQELVRLAMESFWSQKPDGLVLDQQAWRCLGDDEAERYYKFDAMIIADHVSKRLRAVDEMGIRSANSLAWLALIGALIIVGTMNMNFRLSSLLEDVPPYGPNDGTTVYYVLLYFGLFEMGVIMVLVLSGIFALKVLQKMSSDILTDIDAKTAPVFFATNQMASGIKPLAKDAKKDELGLVRPDDVDVDVVALAGGEAAHGDRRARVAKAGTSIGSPAGSTVRNPLSEVTVTNPLSSLPTAPGAAADGRLSRQGSELLHTPAAWSASTAAAADGLASIKVNAATGSARNSVAGIGARMGSVGGSSNNLVTSEDIDPDTGDVRTVYVDADHLHYLEDGNQYSVVPEYRPDGMVVVRQIKINNLLRMEPEDIRTTWSSLKTNLQHSLSELDDTFAGLNSLLNQGLSGTTAFLLVATQAENQTLQRVFIILFYLGAAIFGYILGRFTSKIRSYAIVVLYEVVIHLNAVLGVHRAVKSSGTSCCLSCCQCCCFCLKFGSAENAIAADAGHVVELVASTSHSTGHTK